MVSEPLKGGIGTADQERNFDAARLVSD